MSSITANGTFVLFFANIISKLFGAFYRLPLSNVLGAEGIGLYQMSFPIYSFLLTFITGGISISLTRKIAMLRANNQSHAIYKQYVLGKNTSIFFGIVLMLLLMLFAYPISTLQGNSEAFYGYFAISIGFVFASLLGAYRGYYQGFGNMFPTAISQVLEQTAKLLFGLLFAYLFLNKGVSFGVFGALLGVSISEVFAFVYFIILNKKKISPTKISLQKSDYVSFIKDIMPVSLSYVILPFSSLIDSFLVVNILKLGGFTTQFATSLYGIETGMILPLINLPNVLISALALASIPDVSFKLAKKVDVKGQLSTMFKTVLLFILPCAVGLFILAKPIISLIFPSLNTSYLTIAVNLLRFSVFEMFFLSFVTITNALLQAMGKVKFAVKSLAFGAIAKALLTLAFVSNLQLNIYGLVLASFFGYFVTTLINVIYIKACTGFRLKSLEVLSPIFSSSIMAIVILLFDGYLNITNSIIGLFALILVAMITYFTIMMLLKQFNFKEIKKALLSRSD